MKKFLLVLASLTLPLIGAATTIVEDFSKDPLQNGWEIWGDSDLFEWDSSAGKLMVTWDSSRQNSFFWRPLNVVLNKQTDFSVSFDLALSYIKAGVDSNKPFTFEIAIGFVNSSNATNHGFIRGTGLDSPNIVEFDYFPDTGFGATISPAVVSSNMQFITTMNFPIELVPDIVYHISMRYLALSNSLYTSLTANGQTVSEIQPVKLPSSFTDFTLDRFSITSYSDSGQTPGFGGSVYAKGTIDNIVIELPQPYTPIIDQIIYLTNSVVIKFHGPKNYTYYLERTEDFKNWTTANGPVNGTDGIMEITDPEACTFQSRFYRLKVQALQQAN